MSMAEGGGEVCLEEEVERLRRSGMSAAEISQKMGVDRGWVEELVEREPGEEVSDSADTGPEEGRGSL
jgi:hypothetical protein